MPETPVTIRGNLVSWTGYGQIAEWLGRGLESLGHAVRYEDYGFRRSYLPQSPWMDARIGRGEPGDWIVHLAPPHHPFDAGERQRTVFFSMWESSGLPAYARDYLNCAELVCVPSTFNARTFVERGVVRPIAVVPLGVSPDEGYTPSPVAPDGPTVFGMAGRTEGGGCRKGLNEGMKAFADAFPLGTEAVELRVKVWEDCLPALDVPPDPRIRVDTTPMLPRQMAAWNHGLTCYFAPTKGEGWGLHTLQAMACGRPVIATTWSATGDFFDARHGWTLPYDLRPARGVYQGTGVWAVPTHAGMVEALRLAHANRDACCALGRAAAARAAEFTWDRTAREFAAALREAGVLAA